MIKQKEVLKKRYGKYRCPLCKGTDIMVNPMASDYADNGNSLHESHCMNYKCKGLFLYEMDKEWIVISPFNPNYIK